MHVSNAYIVRCIIFLKKKIRFDLEIAPCRHCTALWMASQVFYEWSGSRALSTSRAISHITVSTTREAAFFNTRNQKILTRVPINLLFLPFYKKSTPCRAGPATTKRGVGLFYFLWMKTVVCKLEQFTKKKIWRRLLPSQF